MKGAMVCMFCAGTNLPCLGYNLWEWHPVAAAVNALGLVWCLFCAYACYESRGIR